MALLWPPKDPDEVLDYKLDWSSRLAGDLILTSTWITPDTITAVSHSHTDTACTLWLSGGTLGEKLRITNRIVTEGGRTMDQTMVLSIKAK